MVSDKPSVDSIFLAAVELPPDQRSAYLNEACGDDAELRARVERLMAAQTHVAGFLESPAPELGAAEDRLVTEGPGTVIGPYKFLQQIGEGGFGVVFLAEQATPIRRKVALKIVKPGMDTRQVIARFEAERQALAMMDHPNIAKVYDAGVTEQGRSYFVMEFVQGVPINEYCDQCNLPTPERLELFIAVCQAVQHAHQKGVIHRDLKPSNVLVAMQDGWAAPKIIDFGIAKAIDQRLTEHTLTTGFAQIVGTPLYMSPEQAELSPLGVDTRSDIYSLGVLLYELLTGTTPFDKDRLHAVTYDEFRRIIRDEEPPRPSARISTMAAEMATTVAERHRTERHRLQQSVRGDLDWIVMKCLEKDRNRRYDSAGNLARDVERYLRDEPVQACPPSARYRFHKYARRNKGLLAASGAIAAALIFGLALSTWMYFRATTESARATAVSDLMQEMLASSNPDQAKGSKYTVRELLDDFSATFDDQLAAQPEVEAAIRTVIGKSYWRLGVYDRADVNLKRALDLRKQLSGDDDGQVAASLIDYAWNLASVGRNAEAETHSREALSIYRNDGRNSRGTVRALRSLQQFLIQQSRYAEAEQAAQEALALAGNEKDSDYEELPNILHSLAEAKSSQGKYNEAEQFARRAVKVHRRLHGDQHPETAWGLFNLGIALREQQKLAEAEQVFREALAIFHKHYSSDHISIQSVQPQLELVLKARGDQVALAALESEQSRDANRFETADYHMRLARLLASKDSQSRGDEARRHIQEAMEACSRVAADFPEDMNRRVRALDDYAVLVGECAAAPELVGEIDELNRRLESELPRLLADFPDSSDCHWHVAMVYRGWGFELSSYPERLLKAEQAIDKSLLLLTELAKSKPNWPGIWLYLADTYNSQSDVKLRLAKPVAADAVYGQAREILEQQFDQLAADAPSNEVFAIALNHICAADYLASVGRTAEAAEFLGKAGGIVEHVTDRAQLVDCQFAMAMVQLRLGNNQAYLDNCHKLPPRSENYANDEIRLRSIWVWCLAPQSAEDARAQLERAKEFANKNSLGAHYCDLLILGAAHFRTGQYELATQCLQESIATYPDEPPFGMGKVAFPQVFLAMTRWNQGKHEEARDLLADALPRIDEWLKSPVAPWYGRAQLSALRREAVALIGREQFTESKPATNTQRDPNNEESTNTDLISTRP